METVKYNKMKSRTFWLVASWCSFIPLGIIAAVLVAPLGIIIPLGGIVTAAAAITSLFMAGEKGAKIFREKNGKLG